MAAPKAGKRVAFADISNCAVQQATPKAAGNEHSGAPSSAAAGALDLPLEEQALPVMSAGSQGRAGCEAAAAFAGQAALLSADRQPRLQLQHTDRHDDWQRRLEASPELEAALAQLHAAKMQRVAAWAGKDSAQAATAVHSSQGPAESAQSEADASADVLLLQLELQVANKKLVRPAWSCMACLVSNCMAASTAGDRAVACPACFLGLPTPVADSSVPGGWNSQVCCCAGATQHEASSHRGRAECSAAVCCSSSGELAGSHDS